MKTTNERENNIIKRASELASETFTNYDEAEAWLYENQVDERHEVVVKSLGNHGQRIDFEDYWSQGEIVDFSDNWHKSPETEINVERFVNDEGLVMQLYYVVGETQSNVPDGYYFKEGKHVKSITYWTADREAGNKIEAFDSKEEAEEAIEEYEEEDKEDGNFSENFYSIIEE